MSYDKLTSEQLDWVIHELDELSYREHSLSKECDLALFGLLELRGLRNAKRPHNPTTVIGGVSYHGIVDGHSMKPESHDEEPKIIGPIESFKANTMVEIIKDGRIVLADFDGMGQAASVVDMSGVTRSDDLWTRHFTDVKDLSIKVLRDDLDNDEDCPTLEVEVYVNGEKHSFWGYMSSVHRTDKGAVYIGIDDY